MTVVVLTRHGQSQWNSRRLFTGWSDPPLSEEGEHQARHAGAALAARQVTIDRVYTSLLSRARQTASIMLAVAGAHPVPVATDWRLNERHLGRLEGLTKAQVAARWGNDRRKRWRDDHLSRPPSLDPEDTGHPRHDPRYRHVAPDRLPGSERELDTAQRVLEFWHERAVPDLLVGRNVMVVSHLGPLRILARHVSWPAPEGAPLVHWPNAEPLLWRVPTHRCCEQATCPASE